MATEILNTQSELDGDHAVTLRLRPSEIAWLPKLSVTGLAAVAVLASVFLITSLHRLNHTDVWGHLSFGRWIVEHGQLPTQDPFREHGFALQFVNQPWLSQVLGYLVEAAGGIDGLVLAHAVLLALTCGAAMGAIRARGVSWGWAIAGGAISYLLSLPILGTLRPQLFGELGFALTLLGGIQLLHRKQPLFWLPVVFAAWANLHGSVPMGLLTLGCLAVGHIWETWRSVGNWREVLLDGATRRFALAGMLCLAASCANPTGWRMLTDAASFAGNANLATISEWQPLTIHSLTGSLFFGSLLVTIVLVRISPRRIAAHEILIAGLLAFGTLGAIRMLAWWAIVWPWLVAPHVAAVFNSRFYQRPVAATTFRTLTALAIVFAALVWSPATHGMLSGRSRSEVNGANIHTPFFLVKALQDQKITGKIYAPMDWADYLIWKTECAVQPLVYSHVHLAATGVFDDYRRIAACDAAWFDIAAFHQLRYIVARCEGGRGLENLIVNSPRCRVIYRDQQAVLAEILPAR